MGFILRLKRSKKPDRQRVKNDLLWLGTEILFQTAQKETPNIDEIPKYEGFSDSRTTMPVFFEIKRSAYDNHPFIQGSFVFREKCFLAEKIFLGGWTDEDFSQKNQGEFLKWITEKLTSKEGVATIHFTQGAPFLAIQPRQQKLAWFYSVFDPATSARTFPLPTPLGQPDRGERVEEATA